MRKMCCFTCKYNIVDGCQSIVIHQVAYCMSAGTHVNVVSEGTLENKSARFVLSVATGPHVPARGEHTST
jgi:hypothetical protein